MPCCADAVHIGKCGDIPGRRYTAHLADMHPDKVNQLPGDQRLPFTRIVEKFPHRNRRTALLTDVMKPLQIFGCQRVF